MIGEWSWKASKKVTFEQELREAAMWICRGRIFQTERGAGAKALR